MNVTNENTVNVQTNGQNTQQKQVNSTDKKFADELEDVSLQKNNKNTTKDANNEEKEKCKNVDKVFDGLNETIEELKQLNEENLKEKYEEAILIENNMNLQEQQDKFNMLMNGSMNFENNGQQFSDLINQGNSKNNLSSSAKDLAEEEEIMSTMEENIAIANRNMTISRTKIVNNENGIYKIDKKTNLLVDTITDYRNIIMNKEDVDFFVNLVENGFLEMDDVKQTQRSSHISKTLADMLAKAMNDNKPIRIDFDNDISVIIKINKAGKISADFLPSTQIAEAYLKENLPLLKERFDKNNIDYENLNHRQRKQDSQENNKKKEQNNE